MNGIWGVSSVRGVLLQDFLQHRHERSPVHTGELIPIGCRLSQCTLTKPSFTTAWPCHIICDEEWYPKYQWNFLCAKRKGELMNQKGKETWKSSPR